MSSVSLSTPTTTKKIWTDAELMALTDGKCYELVNGELIDIGNSGALHGYTCSFLIMALMNYILPRELGIILDSSTAFTMKNGNKRSPDISFVSRDKLKGLTELPDGFLSEEDKKVSSKMQIKSWRSHTIGNKILKKYLRQTQ